MLQVALVVVASFRPVSAQAVPEFSLLHGDYIEIGALGGPSSAEFVGIVSALLLENGEVVVADGGDHRIHWLDGAGNLIRTLGQEGAGPAEFRGLHWLGSCPDDELIAIDPINRRATFLARNSVAWSGPDLFHQCSVSLRRSRASPLINCSSLWTDPASAGHPDVSPLHLRVSSRSN